MAQFTITTTKEEQQKVLQVLCNLHGIVTPVSKIAKLADLRPTRTRYILEDLVEAGKIKREIARAINPHYIRYKYKVLDNKGEKNNECS